MANAGVRNNGLGDLSQNRSKSRARLDDGAFRPEGAAGSNGESGGNGFQKSHTHAHATLAHQNSLHGLRDSVTFECGLPEMDHDAHQQPTDRRNQNHPGAKVMVRRVGDRERKLAVEKDVGEQIDEFEQTLRYQSRNKSHHQCVRADFND